MMKFFLAREPCYFCRKLEGLFGRALARLSSHRISPSQIVFVCNRAGAGSKSWFDSSCPLCHRLDPKRSETWLTQGERRSNCAESVLTVVALLLHAPFSTRS